MEANTEKTWALVGAGPGDPDLLTIKAYRIIQKAEVILYDNLANASILDIAPGSCKKIYLGDAICEDFTSRTRLLEDVVNYSSVNKCIVRLKGGHPFLLGWEAEELRFARQHEFEVIYVPGISSMQALGQCHIPLTHRGISKGIWTINGTKSEDPFSSDLAFALTTHSTIVIYAGMDKLETIAGLYQYRQAGDTPAAIIQDISTAGQKIVLTTAGQLAAIASQHQLNQLALIVIGQVTRLERTVTSASSALPM